MRKIQYFVEILQACPQDATVRFVRETFNGVVEKDDPIHPCGITSRQMVMALGESTEENMNIKHLVDYLLPYSGQELTMKNLFKAGL